MAHVLGVIDLTFQNIAEEADLTAAVTSAMTIIRQPKVRSPPSSPKRAGNGTPSKRPETNNHKTSESPPSSPARKKQPEIIKAIRLSNNSVSMLQILYQPLSLGLDTSKILWIDLSFNNLSTVDEEMANVIPNLTTLNLHANQISRLKELKKFSAFKNLHALTLFGNPVEEHKHYRNFILYNCPTLTQFDLSPVIKSEIAQVQVWSQTFRKKLNPEEEEY